MGQEINYIIRNYQWVVCCYTNCVWVDHRWGRLRLCNLKVNKINEEPGAKSTADKDLTFNNGLLFAFFASAEECFIKPSVSWRHTLPICSFLTNYTLQTEEITLKRITTNQIYLLIFYKIIPICHTLNIMIYGTKTVCYYMLGMT